MRIIFRFVPFPRVRQKEIKLSSVSFSRKTEPISYMYEEIYLKVAHTIMGDGRSEICGQTGRLETQAGGDNEVLRQNCLFGLKIQYRYDELQNVIRKLTEAE